MLFHKPKNLLIKSLSTITSTPTNLNWRTQIKENQLISQISSILLQRHNWASLLKTLNLYSKLTPPLFLQILNKTQTHPQISLNFFKWVIQNTGFQPDLTTHCKMTQILIGSGMVSHARPILDSLIQDHPPAQIVESLIKSCKGTNFNTQSLVLSSVLDWYCEKGKHLQALEVFKLSKDLTKKNKSKDSLELFSVHSCNTLLNALQEKNDIRLALCYYAFMLRNGVLVNRSTWRIVARILSKEGKIESIVRIIDTGICDPLIYNLVIECCSKKGIFEVALNLLDEMLKRKLVPGFNTYISILDGACRHENAKVIVLAMDSMVEKGYILKPLMEYDSIIQKLCNMRKTYAIDMLLKRVSDEKISLKDDTHGFILKSFSMEGRAKDAIGIYRIMEQKGIKANNSCYDAFTDVLCKKDPSREISALLIDMISRGYKPSSLELSKYITSQCDKRRWQEAEELVNFSLERFIFLEASCCCSLVKHYCKTRHIDSVISLHDKMEKREMTLDLSTYNVLLGALFIEMRVDVAERMFDYMRMKNLLSSKSFSIMISGLCRENELRKAMKLHDEMLKLELKPDGKTYKRLISYFK